MKKTMSPKERAGLQGELERMFMPTIEAEGMELVGVEVAGTPGRMILKVFLDKEEGVTIDDCARVSRQLSALLDVEDPIMGRYTLEVSSPGEDRPLFTFAQFKRYIGKEVKLKVFKAMDGNRKNYIGQLQEALENPERVTLKLEKGFVTVKLTNIQKANLHPQVEAFNTIPKRPKKKKARQKPSKKKSGEKKKLRNKK